MPHGLAGLRVRIVNQQVLPWIVVLAVAVIMPLLTILALRGRKPAAPKPLPTEWALTGRPVFTADERRIYRLLREALPHHIILSKLPLVRFCQPTDATAVRYWFDLLGANHVTFAVCSANGRVLAAIERLAGERPDGAIPDGASPGTVVPGHQRRILGRDPPRDVELVMVTMGVLDRRGGLADPTHTGHRLHHRRPPRRGRRGSPRRGSRAGATCRSSSAACTRPAPADAAAASFIKEVQSEVDAAK